MNYYYQITFINSNATTEEGLVSSTNLCIHTKRLRIQGWGYTSTKMFNKTFSISIYPHTDVTYAHLLISTFCKYSRVCSYITVYSPLGEYYL